MTLTLLLLFYARFLLLICLKWARDLCDKVKKRRREQTDVLAYSVRRRRHEGIVHIQKAGGPPDFRTRVHFNPVHNRLPQPAGESGLAWGLCYVLTLEEGNFRPLVEEDLKRPSKVQLSGPKAAVTLQYTTRLVAFDPQPAELAPPETVISKKMKVSGLLIICVCSLSHTHVLRRTRCPIIMSCIIRCP